MAYRREFNPAKAFVRAVIEFVALTKRELYGSAGFRFPDKAKEENTHLEILRVISCF
jgi:hypothetical protein